MNDLSTDGDDFVLIQINLYLVMDQERPIVRLGDTTW